MNIYIGMLAGKTKRIEVKAIVLPISLVKLNKLSMLNGSYQFTIVELVMAGVSGLGNIVVIFDTLSIIPEVELKM